MTLAKFPTIYTIILNFNGYEDTSNCISSLQLISYLNYQIIVVDNDSSDNSLQLLIKKFPDIVFLKTENNKGYAGGMNIGVKYALGNNAEYILLSNNDIVFEENFLSQLVDTFQNNQNIGIVSPKVLYMHNKDLIYCAGGEFKYYLCCGVNRFQGKPDSDFGNKAEIITHAEGSCLLVKAEVFQKVGLLNEKYFMYFEDVEFSQRVRKQFKIFYNSQSKVYHKAGAGLSWSNYTPLYYYYFTRNRQLFFSSYNISLKLYSVIFTFSNSIAKTFILLWSFCISKRSKRNQLLSIKNLWQGTLDGTKIIMNSILK